MVLYKNFTPIVSIVLPTFNRSELLKRAIASVISQTFSDWELVIVDDGSSDSTFNLVNEYLEKHENIRYIKHKNRKVTLSMNVGILTSCSEYITFLGSDDEYKPDHIKLRIEYLSSCEADIIHGGAEIIGDQYVQDKNDLSKKIHLSECILGGTLFGKRESFIKIGGFRNLDYSGESDLVERAEKLFKIERVTYPTYIYYRDTPDSICNNIGENKMELLRFMDVLQKLNNDSKPQWGQMNVAHMIEHLIYSIKISNGKLSAKCEQEEKKLSILKRVLNSSRPMPKNFRNPNVDYTYNAEFKDFEESKGILKGEIIEFYKYFEKNPEDKLTNPTFGDLNREEWIQFHKKHLSHHLAQFNLIDENE